MNSNDLKSEIVKAYGIKTGYALNQLINGDLTLPTCDRVMAGKKVNKSSELLIRRKLKL